MKQVRIPAVFFSLAPSSNHIALCLNIRASVLYRKKVKGEKKFMKRKESMKKERKLFKIEKGKKGQM